jgi:hypothetical protein
MWPFGKKSAVKPARSQEVFFCQVDITERFDDNLSLGPADWIDTSPLNARLPNPAAQGLPLLGATEEEVYSVAERMSKLRESIPIPDDGVYCPICHMANVTLSLLRTPCPKCGRALLKFGWD